MGSGIRNAEQGQAQRRARFPCTQESSKARGHPPQIRHEKRTPRINSSPAPRWERQGAPARLETPPPWGFSQSGAKGVRLWFCGAKGVRLWFWVLGGQRRRLGRSSAIVAY